MLVLFWLDIHTVFRRENDNKIECYCIMPMAEKPNQEGRTHDEEYPYVPSYVRPHRTVGTPSQKGSIHWGSTRNGWAKFAGYGCGRVEFFTGRVSTQSIHNQNKLYLTEETNLPNWEKPSFLICCSIFWRLFWSLVKKEERYFLL